MKPAAAALVIALCLSACGRGGAGGTGTGFLESAPSDSDFAQAIQTRHPDHPIVAAKLDQCREETVDGRVVQVCGFCFVAVGLAYSDDTIERGAYLRAVRRTGDVVFARTASPGQSGGEAERARREVWLASSIRHDASVESAPLSDDLMSRAGHRRRAGIGTFVRWMFQSPTSLGPLGKVADPVVNRTFASDAELRSETADLVGACGREGGHWRGRTPASAGPQPVRRA
jgi:hypothetical protein